MPTETAKQTRAKPAGSKKAAPSLDKHVENTAQPKRKQELHPKMKERMWKKGDPSPNPKGRPRYKTLSESLRAFLEQPIDKRKPDSMTVAEAIATGVLDKARGKKSKADVRAFEAVRDTVEGKPAQRVEIQGGHESKERDRQVRFLSHTVKKTREELGAKVTVEEIWTAIEVREKEIFGEDVAALKEAVLATVIGEGE